MLQIVVTPGVVTSVLDLEYHLLQLPPVTAGPLASLQAPPSGQ